MASIARILNNFKVAIITIVVIVSFLLSSLCWRHIEAVESTRIIVAAAILITMYVLMIFEVVDRTLAALIGAAMSVAAHNCLVELATLEEIVKWEDLETLSLLFGMMIVVNVLGESGLFNYLAVWSYAKSGGHFWLLIIIMSCITAFLSALIDNVSTMLLMAPTLIKLSELEHIDPRYMLMIMVIISNIGGVATPIGDPPNLIIIGNPLVSSLGISFGYFCAICTPCAILCTASSLIYLRLVYKGKESFRLARSSDGDDNQITPNESLIVEEYRALMKLRADMDELGEEVTDECIQLKLQLENLTAKHQSTIEEMELQQVLSQRTSILPISRDARRSSRLSIEGMEKLRVAHRIKSRTILIQSLGTLAVAIILFFVQSLPGVNLTLGWVSLFAGLILLIMNSSVKVGPAQHESSHQDHEEENFDRIICKIEWSTLMFFFALFIVMEVMAKLGLIVFLGHQITNLVEMIPSGPMRTAGAITIVLWASGLASAFVDNVPFTSMMIKILGTLIIHSRAAGSTGDANLEALVFALAFGASLGGNGTLIGASANLVTAGIAGRSGYPIAFNQFIKFAAPLTLLTLVVSNLYLIFVFVVI